uniref:Uncharacterized protein n=1 Tax=Anopheles maculatus TaxID=74869 RepID=A0A182SR04_9DIPT
MTIRDMPEVPVLMVGNFCGESKPHSTEEYLRPLVKELNELMQNGIMIANKVVEVRVRALIANSPARAFIKCVAYFNHKHGCQKCTVEESIIVVRELCIFWQSMLQLEQMRISGR